MRVRASPPVFVGAEARAAVVTIARFGAVGTSGYVLNLCVFALLVDGLGTSPIAAAVVAFVVALLSNFLLNRFWTFAAAGPRASRQLLRYAIVSTATFGLNVVVLAGLIDVGVDPIVSQALAIAWIAPVNFLVCRRWVFRTDFRAGDTPLEASTDRPPDTPVDRRPPRPALKPIDLAAVVLLVGAVYWLAGAQVGPLLTLSAAVLAFAVVVRRAMPAREKRAAILTSAVIVSIGNYLVWRAEVINWDAAWLSLPLYVAEVFAAVHILGFHYTLWPRQPPALADEEDPTRRPVFILIPTVDEGVDVVGPTVRGALAARRQFLDRHPHGRVEIVVCNDGGVAGADCSDSVEAFCQEIGVHCVTRVIGGGAKAGNLEHARRLVGATGDALMVVFDADQVAKPAFLLATIPRFRDSSVAWVQTGQHYGNLENPVARWADDQQAIFYRVLCQGKAACNSAFICGTNVAIRAEALDEIGGFPQTSVTEDFAASIVLHQRWRSEFVPGVLAVGLGPVELGGYLGQQRRWARGSIGVLRSHWRDIFLPRRRGGLHPEQRAEYALASTHYLCGLRDLIYVTIPVVYLFTGISAVRGANLEQFLAYFVPFWVLTQFAFWHATRGKASWRGIVIGFGSFPVLVSAAAAALIRGGGPFTVTSKRRVGGGTLRHVGVHIGCLFACIGAIVAGGFHGFDAPTLICAFWAAYTGVLLTAFICLAVLDYRLAAPPVFAWAKRLSPRPALAGGLGLAATGVSAIGLSLILSGSTINAAQRPVGITDTVNPAIGLDFTTGLVATDISPSETRWDDHAGLIGRTQQISEDFSRTWANAITVRGGRPLVNLLFTAAGRPNYEASLPSIRNGLHDNDLRRWAHEIAAWGNPVDLTILDAVDRNWAVSSAVDNSGVPQDTAVAWDHVRSIFRSAGATNVKWVWAPADPGADQQYAPASGSYDAVLLTLIEYPHKKWADPAQAIARARRAHPTTPLLIETSLAGPDRARTVWLHELGLAISANHQVVTLIYHEGGPAPTATAAERSAWSLNADPRLTAAFLWAASRVGAGPHVVVSAHRSTTRLTLTPRRAASPHVQGGAR